MGSQPPASLAHHPPRHLHDVHSAAIPTIPSTAAAAYSALQLAALHALNHDPSNDCAAVAFHALPRLLLHPPPPDEPRRHLAATIVSRALRLRRGEALALWHAHDWDAARSANLSEAVTTVPPERQAKLINDAIATHSPSSAFRRLYGAPFAPPTASVAPITLRKVATVTNPDLAPTLISSTLPLPASPATSSVFHDPSERAAVISAWTREIRARPGGAPDGTGFRASYVLNCPDCLPPSPFFATPSALPTSPRPPPLLRHQVHRRTG